SYAVKKLEWHTSAKTACVLIRFYMKKTVSTSYNTPLPTKWRIWLPIRCMASKFEPMARNGKRCCKTSNHYQPLVATITQSKHHRAIIIYIAAPVLHGSLLHSVLSAMRGLTKACITSAKPVTVASLTPSNRLLVNQTLVFSLTGK